MSLIDLGHYLGDQGELEKRLVLVLLRKSILITQVLRIQRTIVSGREREETMVTGTSPNQIRIRSFGGKNLVILFV